MNLRELILDMLLELEKTGGYSHILIRNVMEKHDYLPPRDKAFIKRVTEGTLERRIELDYVIDKFSGTPVAKMKPLIRNLIRMSVYQLMFMDSIPDSAVCNEAVKLASRRKFQSLKGFVNGVLRNIARGYEAVEYPPETDLVRHLSVTCSMPEHLVRLWLDSYGEEQTRTLLTELMRIRPLTIRFREDLPEEQVKELISWMEEDEITVARHPLLPYAYELGHVPGVRQLPGYEEGLFAVQDVSSMLCVEAAGIQPGDFVVDVCAAPGGKAVHAALKLKGQGQISARDVSEEKVALIEENRLRQKAVRLTAKVQDARTLDESVIGKADVVLADLPCSGLGVMGRKRDIKYHVTESLLQELPGLQKEILSVIWQYIKPGGVLLYSTCTVNRQENEDVVQWFLEQYPFEAADLSGTLPEALNKESLNRGYVQLMPGEYGTDGFFFAKLMRKTED